MGDTILVGYQVSDIADILWHGSPLRGLGGSNEVYRTKERAAEAAAEALREQMDGTGQVRLGWDPKQKAPHIQGTTVEYRQASFETVPDLDEGWVTARQTYEFRRIRVSEVRKTVEVDGIEYARMEKQIEVVEDRAPLMATEQRGSWISGYDKRNTPYVGEWRLYLDAVRYEVLD